MHHCLLVVLLTSSALLAFATVDSEENRYSFSQLVGSPSGNSFSLTGEERLTGVRTWDNGNYIYGVEFRYGAIWSEMIGSDTGKMSEFLLHKDESIAQISGMYSRYIQGLVFVTSKGRSMFSGRLSGTSFNMYPEHQGAELRFISGTVSGALTGLAAHWAVFTQSSDPEH